MTAIADQHHSAPAISTGRGCTPGSLLRTGALAGAAAAAATTATAAVARAAGVSLDVPAGHPIPLAGFAQLTFISALLGVALAIGLNRHARRPRFSFLLSTAVLTALSLAAPFAVPAAGSTRTVLVLAHLIAAAVILPGLSGRLPRQHG